MMELESFIVKVPKDLYYKFLEKYLLPYCNKLERLKMSVTSTLV
jgi:hypothetical protein